MDVFCTDDDDDDDGLHEETDADSLPFSEINHGFQLTDAMYFCKRGMEVSKYVHFNKYD